MTSNPDLMRIVQCRFVGAGSRPFTWVLVKVFDCRVLLLVLLSDKFPLPCPPRVSLAVFPKGTLFAARKKGTKPRRSRKIPWGRWLDGLTEVKGLTGLPD